MRVGIVPSRILLPSASVKLGRFITSVTNPHLNHHDPTSSSPLSVMTSVYTSYTGTQQSSHTSRFSSALTSVLSTRFSKAARLNIRVATDQYTASLLDNSDAWFDNATKLPATRAWLERAIDRGDDIFLIVGVHSIADATIIQDSVARSGTECQAEMPLPLVVAPLAAMVDPGVGFERRESAGQQACFVAPGEQICAIEYRKVRHTFLSSKIDKARLGKVRQWPSMERARGEDDGEDDIIEVKLEEELELEGDWDRTVIEDDVLILINSYKES